MTSHNSEIGETIKKYFTFGSVRKQYFINSMEIQNLYNFILKIDNNVDILILNNFMIHLTPMAK